MRHVKHVSDVHIRGRRGGVCPVHFTSEGDVILWVQDIKLHSLDSVLSIFARGLKSNLL